MKGQLKPFKSVEEIARKHRLDVSFIQRQLDMGEPIEHEHTKDHKLAMDIALQHLDEIPDYYTRLKKMEASAKKEHKKFKDVKESNEEQRYCPLCDKRETRSECSYGEKSWDKVSVKDEEYSMARSELATMKDAIKRLQMKVGKGEGNLEAWVQSKITKAADYIDTAADYVGSREMDESKSLGFEIKKSSGVGALTPSAAKQLGDKAVALQKKKAASVSLPKIKKEEKLVDKILGELKEENPCWKGYTQVGMKKKGGKEVPNCVPSKGVPKAKGYKKESVTIEDANGNTFTEVVDIIKPDPINSPKSTFMSNNRFDEAVYGGVKKEPEDKRMTITAADKKANTPAYQKYKAGDKRYKAAAGHGIDEATRLQSETGNIIAVILSWRGKTYSIRMFFPQVGMPSRKDITSEIQKVYPGAQVLQYNVSGIQPGMPLIQVVNSKSKNYLLNNGTIGEEKIEEVAAWQRKEGKSESGGLNEKGRKSYEREHPGSNLKRPQPEGGSRRDSFCARMKGMKKKLTSAKTANDPDSRINKSLRAWNC